jgi:hypothetical protein
MRLTMFELAVLRRTGNGEDIIDVGLLAETLLFYQRVHLVFDSGTLGYLAKTIGPDLLLEVLDRRGVSASFLREFLGTVTTRESGLTFHNFAQFRVDPPEKLGKPKKITDDKWVALQLERQLGAGRATAQFTRKLIKKLSSANWKDSALGSKDVPALTREDLNDIEFVDQAVRRVVNALVPSFVIPSGWYFRTMVIGSRAGADQFVVDTNFNFEQLNQEYHKIIPPSHSTLSPEYLVNHLLEARGAIVMGTKYLGELVVDPATAGIVKLKCAELMRKRDAQVRELDLFQELHLPRARKIRECVSSGERSFADFLKLLDHADKFKEWLGNRNPDERLLQEYYRAATADSWIGKLGTKASRWVITTGLAGAVEALYPTGAAIAAAQGISLLDATLLDRLLKGWRPNQFVEGRLANFVSGRDV